MSFLSRLFGKKQEKLPILTAADAPVELTFKERVERFWQWFETVAPRFYQTIENKQSTILTEETSSAVDRFLPRLAWNYGPGENGNGHSLTLSGEGMQPEQILAEETGTEAGGVDLLRGAAGIPKPRRFHDQDRRD